MNRHSLLHYFGILMLIVFLLYGCSALAPTTGKVEGTVTFNGDVSKPLPGVTIRLLNDPFSDSDPSKEIATTITDVQGRYAFEDIKPGKYALAAAVQGQCMVIDLPNPIIVEAGNVVKKDISLPCTP